MFLSGSVEHDPRAGFDLRGRRAIRWEARSLSGKAYVQFVAGGMTWRWDERAKEQVDVRYPDSMPSLKLSEQRLDSNWRRFRVPLDIADENLSAVVGSFGFLVEWTANNVDDRQPRAFVIEVRNILYEGA
jgi:hypothetical protein